MEDGRRIVTFYSYKGGVGRTFILVSVAVKLAEWDRRVLCLDWDLEAPGLSYYLRQWMPSAHGGIVDLTEGLVSQRKSRSSVSFPWREHVVRLDLPGVPGLDVIPAGSVDDYAARVQRIDWPELYSEYSLGERLETFRQEISNDYDIVLIDSRTGVTDAGGICTVQLPDLLAMVFTANDQGLDGTLDIGMRVGRARDRFAYDRTALPIVPLLSRFDAREERHLTNLWLDQAASRLAPLYRPWLPIGIEPRQILERTVIPYFSYWSFGEAIPTIEERGTSPETVSWALETVSALVANGLGDVNTLVNNRDQFVATARLQKRQSHLAYDVFLSYSRRDLTTAQEIAAALRGRGVRAFVDVAGLQAGESWATRLQEALASSRHFVTILQDELTKTQEYELRQFFVGLVDRNVYGRVVTLRKPGQRTPLPPALASFPVVNLTDNAEELVAGLAKELGFESPVGQRVTEKAVAPRPRRVSTTAVELPEGIARDREGVKAWRRTLDPGAYVMCPVCNNTVMARNLIAHLDRNHPYWSK